MDDVFKALADPTRRRLLDSLEERNGQTLGELCAELALTRQAVSKHLAVLEAANLIATQRRGREKLHYLNAEPVNAIADRWINRYHRARVHVLADLKSVLEGSTMSEDFVYVSYIKTTPKQLWQALTEPAFTKQYWGATFDTDWQPGSEMVWHQQNWTGTNPGQVVLAADPYTKLSYTWHTFDETFAEAMGMPAADVAVWGAEPRSTVTFQLEELGEIVKLTVTHDGFPPRSTVLPVISQGWPAILSNLKSLLETGATLPHPEFTAAE